MRKFKFTIRGHEYEVEIKNFENNLAEVEVNGTAYKVEVDRKAKVSKTPKLVRQVSRPTPGSERIQKTSTEGEVPIKSPLPGSITKILVKAGDNVKKGDKLMIMEAMKMENNVLAEREGTIKSIKVSEGQSVLQGDVLLEIG